MPWRAKRYMGGEKTGMAFTLINSDCFEWMSRQQENSITAIVTDPPYGVREYTETEIAKQRSGKGGLWRIPPAFDGHVRQAVPRFSVINDGPQERENVYKFFCTLGTECPAFVSARRTCLYRINTVAVRYLGKGNAGCRI